jgi:hypothetical protein
MIVFIARKYTVITINLWGFENMVLMNEYMAENEGKVAADFFYPFK